MERFNVFKADRVVCDQTFQVQDIEVDIPIRCKVTSESRFDPDRSRVKVTMTECDLITDQDNDQFIIDLDILIEKCLFIKNINCIEPIQFSFQKRFRGLNVTECKPSQVPDCLLRRLRCQLFDITASDNLRLNTLTNTFNQTLTITLVIKIVFEDQIPLPTLPPTRQFRIRTCVHRFKKPMICAAPPTPLPLPPLPASILQALKILEGKIRTQVGNPHFKAKLLGKAFKAEEKIKAGQLTETLVIIQAIADELQHSLNLSPSERDRLSLVRGDLLIVEEELVSLF